MFRPASSLRAGVLPPGPYPAGFRNLAGGYALVDSWPGSNRGHHRWWWARSVGSIASGSGDTPSEAAPEADEELPVQRRRRAEAVLLFHRGPIHLRKLATLAALADATEARTRIRELNELYDRTGSALRVEEVAGGHQLLTRAALAPWLRRIGHVPPPVQLGNAAMETLAIIAYRQPVLRADVEAIRGVACGELIRQLMQKDLVRISGRSEELGRPYLYGTTSYFLQIFGLKNAGSLPAVAGASIPDDYEDTLANSEDQSQAAPCVAPIEPPVNVDLPPSALSPFDAVPPKESDVSIAPGPVVIDEAADLLTLDSPIAPRLSRNSPEVAVVDDDDEYFDDADDEDDEDEDVWEDDEDEDLDEEEDDELDNQWEEVGDEDEDEDEDEAEGDDAEEVEVEVDEDEDDDIDDEDDDIDDEDDEDEILSDDEDEDDDEWEDDEWEEDDDDDDDEWD